MEQKIEIMALTKQNSALADKLLSMSLSHQQIDTPNGSLEQSKYEDVGQYHLNVLHTELSNVEIESRGHGSTFEEFKVNDHQKSELIKNRDHHDGLLNPHNFMLNREREGEGNQIRRLRTHVSSGSYGTQDHEGEREGDGYRDEDVDREGVDRH